MVRNRLLPMVLVTAAISGCLNGPGETRTIRAVNQQMERRDQLLEELAERDRVVVRSQQPSSPDAETPILPPFDEPMDVRGQATVGTPPNDGRGRASVGVTPNDGRGRAIVAPATVLSGSPAPAEPATPLPKGDAQVRIVAVIGATPIYEREVREAVYQRSSELANLVEAHRKTKEKAMFQEELKRLIERELILDEMMARLKSQKRTNQIDKLQEVAETEADARMRDIRRRVQVPSDKDFKSFLESQGLTASGLKRHFARGTMMNIFLTEFLKPKVKSISLADLRDYYDSHPQEYQTGDRLKWQDIFIPMDAFPDPAQTRRQVDQLLARVRRGEDFAKLAKEFDRGDSKERNGFGFGDEKGKIFPPEVEPTLFNLKQGEASLVEMESGFHLVRIAERTYAGKQPFWNEALQQEIRRKVEMQINEREYQRLVQDLWQKMQPRILIELEK